MPSENTVAEAMLDASALIAFLRDELGAEKVAEVLTRSCISAVNPAEVLSKMAGLSLGDRAFLALGIYNQWQVMTSDRAWTEADVGAKVEFIR